MPSANHVMLLNNVAYVPAIIVMNVERSVPHAAFAKESFVGIAATCIPANAAIQQYARNVQQKNIRLFSAAICDDRDIVIVAA